ncbi:hypothetical protein EJ02DRAFT_80473 [Clathrospora elynae]|uniref:Uncharacterized protein n=1 Tax=Clathrospora elynae TaxID=706981 RepID=A0A6A5SA14_9PLEO|nr:hypothetical protein EJ02DRAFT_80473 [Clathrospora elynae]
MSWHCLLSTSTPTHPPTVAVPDTTRAKKAASMALRLEILELKVKDRPGMTVSLTSLLTQGFDPRHSLHFHRLSPLAKYSLLT